MFSRMPVTAAILSFKIRTLFHFGAPSNKDNGYRGMRICNPGRSRGPIRVVCVCVFVL